MIRVLLPLLVMFLSVPAQAVPGSIQDVLGTYPIRTTGVGVDCPTDPGNQRFEVVSISGNTIRVAWDGQPAEGTFNPADMTFRFVHNATDSGRVVASAELNGRFIRGPADVRIDMRLNWGRGIQCVGQISGVKPAPALNDGATDTVDDVLEPEEDDDDSTLRTLLFLALFGLAGGVGLGLGRRGRTEPSTPRSTEPFNWRTRFFRYADSPNALDPGGAGIPDPEGAAPPVSEWYTPSEPPSEDVAPPVSEWYTSSENMPPFEDENVFVTEDPAKGDKPPPVPDQVQDDVGRHHEFEFRHTWKWHDGKRVSVYEANGWKRVYAEDGRTGSWSILASGELEVTWDNSGDPPTREDLKLSEDGKTMEGSYFHGPFGPDGGRSGERITIERAPPRKR